MAVQGSDPGTVGLLLNEVVRRYTEKGIKVGFRDSLPLSELFTLVDHHVDVRRSLHDLEQDLALRCRQYRAVQKRLLAKAKDRTPTTMQELAKLLEMTHATMIDVAQAGAEARTAQSAIRARLEAAVEMVLILMRLRFELDEVNFAALQAFWRQPHTEDAEGQGWEEALDAALHAKATSESERLRALNSRERLKWLVRARLEMLGPKLDSWPGALAAMATPEHATATLRRRAALADFIADVAGLDDASDSLSEPVDSVRRALERVAIGAIYTVVELRLITDSSERHRETWSLLDRAVDDFAARRVDLLELRSHVDVLLRDVTARRSNAFDPTALIRAFRHRLFPDASE